MRKIFNVLLVAAAALLIYMCVMSIYSPIKFDEEKAAREVDVIQHLVDIRKAEIEFKNLNGHYTGSFDTLIDFINNGKIPVVLKEGTLSDEQLKSGLTEAEAVKQGLIRRDTSYVSVKESLFSENYNAENIKVVPFSNGKEFELAAQSIQVSGLDIWVFEAKTDYKTYLGGINDQEVINLIEAKNKLKRYPGLKVGSIEESNNNAGNWE